MKNLLHYLACFLLVLGSPLNVLMATDYYVSGTGNDATGDGSVGNPWRTISQALTVAAPGDSITVATGTYDTAAGESFPLNIPPAVLVQGPADGTAIVVDDSVVPFGSAVIELAGGGSSTISGLSIVETGTGFFDGGISLSWSHTSINILNNSITGGSYGVIGLFSSTSNSPNINISGNTINDNSIYGIALLGYDAVFHCILGNNTLDNGGIGGLGVFVFNYAYANLAEPTWVVDGNTISGYDAGILMGGTAGASTTNSISINLLKNDVSQCGLHGVQLVGAVSSSATSAAQILSADVQNNKLHENGVAGLLLVASAGVNPPASGSDYLYNYLNLSQNTITGNGVGVELIATSLTSVSNSADFIFGIGTIGSARGLNTICGNDVAGSGGGVWDMRLLWPEASVNTIRASGNWWSADDISELGAYIQDGNDSPGYMTLDSISPCEDELAFSLDNEAPTFGEVVTATALTAETAFVPMAGNDTISITAGGVAVADSAITVTSSFSAVRFVWPDGTSGTNVVIENPGGQCSESSGGGGSGSGGGGGGCFIATAAYGDYDAPQVKLLRNWRDGSLANNSVGRAFTKAYYQVSPTLASWSADRPVVRKVSRVVLAPVIGILRLWMELPLAVMALMALAGWRLCARARA